MVNKALLHVDNLLFSDNSQASRYASIQAVEYFGIWIAIFVVENLQQQIRLVFWHTANFC